MKAPKTKGPLVFSQPGDSVAHIERRPTGALLLVIPMTLAEALVLLEAAQHGLQHVNADNAHLNWVMGRIAAQWRFAAAEKQDADGARTCDSNCRAGHSLDCDVRQAAVSS